MLQQPVCFTKESYEVIILIFGLARGWQCIQSQWNVPLINSVAFDGSYPILSSYLLIILIMRTYIYYCIYNKKGIFFAKTGTGYNGTVPQRIYSAVPVPSRFGKRPTYYILDTLLHFNLPFY